MWRESKKKVQEEEVRGWEEKSKIEMSREGQMKRKLIRKKIEGRYNKLSERK